MSSGTSWLDAVLVGAALLDHLKRDRKPAIVHCIIDALKYTRM
jgi:hypothetical protein